MPVAYELFEGSPTIEVTRKETRGTQRGRILWSDIQAFVGEIFPDPFLTGYAYGASLPGFPWAVAKGLKIKPFDPNLPPFLADDWRAWHDYAEFEVEYGIPDDNLSANTPAGASGVTFTSYKVHCGGEYLSYPSTALSWDTLAFPDLPALGGNVFAKTSLAKLTAPTDTVVTCNGTTLPQTKNLMLRIGGDGDTYEYCKVSKVELNKKGYTYFTVQRGGTTSAGPFGGAGSSWAADKDVLIFDPSAGQAAQTDVDAPGVATVATPLIEHTLEWNYVVQPPWLAIRSLMGKVNAYPFMGAPSECMLFLGAEASIEVNSQGVQCWKLSYKMSEKNQNAANPFDPQGWNFFLRPNGDSAGTFQRLGKKVATGDAGNTPVAPLALGIGAGGNVVLPLGEPFPQTGQFMVAIADADGTNIEYAAVTPGVGATLRGVRGTTTRAHGVGSLVTQVPGNIYDLADLSFLTPVLP